MAAMIKQRCSSPFVAQRRVCFPIFSLLKVMESRLGERGSRGQQDAKREVAVQRVLDVPVESVKVWMCVVRPAPYEKTSDTL